MVRLLKHTLILVVLLFVQLHNVKSENALYSEAIIFAQEDNFVIHTIQKGETLFSLSRRYNVKLDDIYSANPGLTPETAYADRKIRIPVNPNANTATQVKSVTENPVVSESKTESKVESKTESKVESKTESKVTSETPEANFIVHTILKGENFYSIAEKYGVERNAIMSANPGLSVQTFYADRKIRIPVNPTTQVTRNTFDKIPQTAIPSINVEGAKTPESLLVIMSETKDVAESSPVSKGKITAISTTQVETATETQVVTEKKAVTETPVVAETKTEENKVTAETQVVTEKKAVTETPIVAETKTEENKVTAETQVVTEKKAVTVTETPVPVAVVAETKTIAEPLLVAENTNNNYLKNSDLSIVRFDIDLYRYLNDLQPMDSLIRNHKFFLRVYGEQIIGIGKPESEDFYKKFNKFFTEPTLMSLYEDQQFRFKDLRYVENELGPALDALFAEFPMMIRPTVYAHVSGLNQNVVVTDDILSISLDKYMGANYSFYKRYFYDYQLQKMTPNRIVPDYILGYLMANFPFRGNDDILLDRMIYEGKLRYLLTRFLPHRTLWDCLSYTENQHSWCEKNHSQIWKTILRNDHLNVPDYMTTAKYLNNASHTITISTESPGGVGIWIGYQIVDAYMKNNPGTTLSKLMSLSDAQLFLKNSKYKP